MLNTKELNIESVVHPSSDNNQRDIERDKSHNASLLVHVFVQGVDN